jgi:hypothetical protein
MRRDWCDGVHGATQPFHLRASFTSAGKAPERDRVAISDRVNVRSRNNKVHGTVSVDEIINTFHQLSKYLDAAWEPRHLGR